MNDFAGNVSTTLFGVVGGAIGFIVIGFIILVLFIPIVAWMRRSSRQPAQHSGLERFAASLDTPDEGYHDRIPEAPVVARSDGRGTGSVPNQGIVRPTSSRVEDSFPAGGSGEPLTSR